MKAKVVLNELPFPQDVFLQKAKELSEKVFLIQSTNQNSKTEKSEMILFNLDINHICASGGSACTSGADQGSHVIRAINNNANQVTVRFSFSKHNTKEEIDIVVEKLKELI